ncbi:MAG: ATP-binding protein [Desulfobacterales bacterium]|jgi:two-component system phosphate regulon sensor histidine kinase PhoR|nr:ATP-binding protein [Desulfobacterales bacterium]
MKKKRRLIWQLYPSYLLLILLSLSAVGWYVTRSFHHFFINRIQNDLQSQGQFLKYQLSGLISPFNAEAVDRLCKAVGKNVATRITVILPDGTVAGDSNEMPVHMENHGGRREIQQALTGKIGSAIRYSKTLQQNMMYVAQPVSNGDNTAAVIRTSVPLTAVEHEIQSLQIKVLLGGFIIAVAASGLGLFVSRRISLPIEKMTKAAERFSQGDLKQRLDPPGTIELAGLANALNQMAMQLENRIETVINQRNEYEAVLTSMLEGVIAVDMQERILSMNGAATRMLNLRTADLKGRNILEAIRNRDVYAFITEALATGIYKEGDVVVHQQGEQVLNIQCTPLCNAGNQRIGTLVVLNDVTRLRNLDTVRREFVANVSHEIKTPLTAIKGFVETLLQGTAETEEEKSRFLGIIKKHADRMGAIIEDLLSLARLEQKDGIDLVSVESRRLKDIIDTAIQIIKGKAEEKKIVFEVVADPDIRANLDGTLIEQAIVNLLDNAVKYSPVASRVQVHAAQSEDEIRIHITDAGPGIPSQHLPRIFERFYRVDKARSRKLGGTGLGLAIVKHICQVHGGNCQVDSELGKGTTFTIAIPKNPVLQSEEKPLNATF